MCVSGRVSTVGAHPEVQGKRVTSCLVEKEGRKTVDVSSKCYPEGVQMEKFQFVAVKY